MFIYGLFDPRTAELRYVGKTIKKLSVRLSQHLYSKENNHRVCWIKSLKSHNLIPIIELIDEVSNSDWKYWERWYISYFKYIGCNLVNATPGGDGEGHPQSRETRQKLSTLKKGIKRSESSVKKQIATRTGMSTRLFGRKHLKEHNSKISKSLIGNQYGVGNTNRRGKHHTENTKTFLGDIQRRLNVSQVCQLLKMRQQGMTQKQIGKYFNISRASVGRILQGKRGYDKIISQLDV